jgi:hypothetical protein
MTYFRCISLNVQGAFNGNPPVVKKAALLPEPEKPEAPKEDSEVVTSSAAVPASLPSEPSGRMTMGQRDSVYEANSKKVYKKRNRPDNKMQKHFVEVVHGPENSNPLYILRLAYDGASVTEITERFGPHRDLYTKLNKNKFCDLFLSAPFPVTMARNAFGIKLNQQQIEERRAGLETVS